MRELRRTSGYTDEESVQKGPLKIITKEELLSQKEQKLIKIENKTEKLIARAKKANKKAKPLNSHTTTTQKPLNYHSTTTQNKREVSYLTYQMMPSKKIPKQILNHVRKNAFKIQNEWYSKIDSFDLSDEIQKEPRELQLAVKRLHAEGWFLIIETSTSGYRRLKIQPETYGL